MVLSVSPCQALAIFVLLASGLGSSVTALAGPIDPPPACATQNFQRYRDFGAAGCLIGDKLFSGFDITRGLNGDGIFDDRGPNSAQITVTPVGAGTLNPGFTFSSSLWDTGQLMGIFLNTITFAVNVQPGGAKIKDASLADEASRVLTGAATAGVLETLCLGDTTNPCPLGNPTKVLNAPLNKDKQTNAADTTFDQLSAVGVSLLISSTSLDPPAGVKEFTVRFSEVPEPSALPLVLLALAAAGLLRSMPTVRRWVLLR